MNDEHDQKDLAGNLDSGSQTLLQFHLAEYTALTTRVSYQLTLQVALWPVVILTIGQAAPLWGRIAHRRLLFWTTSIIVELILAIWYEITIDILNSVEYVETRLRPEIARLARTMAFWQYEEWLGAKNNRVPFLGDWVIPVVLIPTLMAGAVYIHRPWDSWDKVGMIVNGSLAMFLVWRAMCTTMVRRRAVKYTKPAVATEMRD